MMNLGFVKLRYVAIAVVIGTLLLLATGLIKNGFMVGIPEVDHYGYPLVWRSIQFLQQPQTTELNYMNFALDAAFWIGVSIVGVIIGMTDFTRDKGELI